MRSRGLNYYHKNKVSLLTTKEMWMSPSMPAYFVQLLIYQMAWHLAEPVTDQTTKSEYWKTVALGTPLESLRGGYFRQATVIDGSGQSSQVLADYVLVDVR